MSGYEGEVYVKGQRGAHSSYTALCSVTDSVLKFNFEVDLKLTRDIMIENLGPSNVWIVFAKLVTVDDIIIPTATASNTFIQGQEVGWLLSPSRPFVIEHSSFKYILMKCAPGTSAEVQLMALMYN